jgi:hypothetical protein
MLERQLAADFVKSVLVRSRYTNGTQFRSYAMGQGSVKRGALEGGNDSIDPERKAVISPGGWPRLHALFL